LNVIREKKDFVADKRKHGGEYPDPMYGRAGFPPQYDSLCTVYPPQLIVLDERMPSITTGKKEAE
jgi:hypothetical protein